MFSKKMVSYGYQTVDKNFKRHWVGYYECDYVDFRKMWLKLDKSDISICYLYVGQRHDEWEKCYMWMQTKKTWKKIWEKK